MNVYEQIPGTIYLPVISTQSKTGMVSERQSWPNSGNEFDCTHLWKIYCVHYEKYCHINFIISIEQIANIE